MLTAYMTRVQQLMSDLKQDVLNPGMLLEFINTARGQLAGEAECVRLFGNVNTINGQAGYPFTLIDLGTPAATGIQGVLNVRQISRAQTWLIPRPWEYFDYYYLNNSNIAAAPPARWAQYGQGSSGQSSGSIATGTFFVNPTPDNVYVLTCDCVCYPIALANDATVEAIPYLWTDAVPFFTCYLAYLSVQNHERAKTMFGMYSEFKDRARRAVTPPVDRWMYPQSTISQGVDPNLQQQGSR